MNNVTVMKQRGNTGSLSTEALFLLLIKPFCKNCVVFFLLLLENSICGFKTKIPEQFSSS